MKYLNLILFMLALFALSANVSAQPPGYPGRGPMPFSSLDQNRDGAVSQQEFEAVHSQQSLAPKASGYAPRRIADPPRFADFDQNGDGNLSPEELIAGQYRRRAQRQQEMVGPGWRSGPGQALGRGMGPGSERATARGRGRHMPAFSEFDLDGDGALHQQEFEQARAQRIRERLQQGYQMRNLRTAPSFIDIDTDRDGLVSPQEFASAQARHRQP